MIILILIYLHFDFKQIFENKKNKMIDDFFCNEINPLGF